MTRRSVFALFLLCSLLLLAACSMPPEQAPATQPDVVGSPTSPVPPTTPVLSQPGSVDDSCKVDADCTVKNVGNCCGYYPACVNVNSEPDPEAVAAECARTGMAGLCGFPAIGACTCDSGRCKADNRALSIPVNP